MAQRTIIPPASTIPIPTPLPPLTIVRNIPGPINHVRDKFPNDPDTIKIPILPNGEIYVIPYQNSKEIKQYMHPEVLNIINSVYPSDELHLEVFKKYAKELPKIPPARFFQTRPNEYPSKWNADNINSFLAEPRASYNIKMMHRYIDGSLDEYFIDLRKGKRLVSTILNQEGVISKTGLPEAEIVSQTPLSDDIVQIITSIYNEYTSRGYVWHYFGFYKADHPLFLSHVRKLNPSVGTFELANTLIPNNIYPIAEQSLFKSPSEITTEIKHIIFELGIETPIYSKMIEPLHLNRNIKSHYYYHIGPEQDREKKDTRVENRMELVALTYGSKLIWSDMSDKPLSLYTEAIASGNHNLEHVTHMLRNVFKSLGWTRKSIIDSIHNSGLVVHRSQIEDYIKSHYRRPRLSDDVDEEKTAEEKEDNRIIYYGRMSNYWLKVVQQGKVSYKPLAGLNNSISNSKIYYMTIYRKLFGTLGYIDWPLACQQRILGIENLRSVAQSDYYIPKSQVDQMSYDQLCETISQMSIEKRNNALARAKEAVEIFEPLIYQPGGVRNITSETTLARMGATAPKFGPAEAAIVPEITGLCANPSLADRTQLLNIANNLGLPVKPDASNEEICRSLNAYLRVLREARKL